MSRFFFQQVIRRLTIVLVTFILVMSSLAARSEIPASVVEIDLNANTIKLEVLGDPVTEYRMAFDIEIQLLSGEKGFAAALERGDTVVAFVDKDKQMVSRLHVVAKP